MTNVYPICSEALWRKCISRDTICDTKQCDDVWRSGLQIPLPNIQILPITSDGYLLVLGAGRCIFLSFWGCLRSNSLFSLTGNKKKHGYLVNTNKLSLQLNLYLLLVPLQATVCCIHFYLMLLHSYKSNKKTEVICKHFKTHLESHLTFISWCTTPNACTTFCRPHTGSK